MAKASKATQEPPQAAPEPRKAQSNGKHPGGRPPSKPSAYDEAAVQVLFDQMIAGVQLKTACADPRSPHDFAIYQRMWRDKEFFERIARVRESQQHAIIDGLIPMADSATPENWQVVRLQIWARQWAAAKFCPRVFGEKSEVHLTVSDALSDRLTAALKRQKELRSSSVPLLEGVAEAVEPVSIEPAAEPMTSSKSRP